MAPLKRIGPTVYGWIIGLYKSVPEAAVALHFFSCDALDHDCTVVPPQLFDTCILQHTRTHTHQRKECVDGAAVSETQQSVVCCSHGGRQAASGKRQQEVKRIRAWPTRPIGTVPPKASKMLRPNSQQTPLNSCHALAPTAAALALVQFCSMVLSQVRGAPWRVPCLHAYEWCASSHV